MLRSILALGLVSAIWLAGPARGADPAADGAPAPTTTAGPDATGRSDGAELFATHCARCHQAPKLAARLQATPEPAGARAKMTAFLGRHGGTDAEADLAIVEFLASLTP